MDEPDSPVDAGALRARLPSDWTVETTEEGDVIGKIGVNGIPDADEAGSCEPAHEPGVAFEMRRDGELWTATWLDRGGPGADRPRTDRVTGTGERCVEWVLERARGIEETADE